MQHVFQYKAALASNDNSSKAQGDQFIKEMNENFARERTEESRWQSALRFLGV